MTPLGWLGRKTSTQTIIVLLKIISKLKAGSVPNVKVVSTNADTILVAINKRCNTNINEVIRLTNGKPCRCYNTCGYMILWHGLFHWITWRSCDKGSSWYPMPFNRDCFFVSRLFEEKRGDIVFGFLWCVVHSSEFIVGTLWAQLLLQFLTNPSEILQLSSSWTEDVHVLFTESLNFFLFSLFSHF